MENQDGKRVARGPGMPRGGKIALAVVLVLVLALAGGYAVSYTHLTLPTIA